MAMSSSKYKAQVMKAKTRLNILLTDMGRYEKTSDQYKALLKQYTDQQLLITDLAIKAKTAEDLEKKTDKFKSARNKVNSINNQLKILQDAKEQLDGLGLDSTDVTSKITALTSQLEPLRKIVKTNVPVPAVATPAARGSSAPTSGLIPGFTPPKTTYTPPKAGGTGTGGTGTGGTGTGGTRTGGNGTPTQTVAQREAAAENVMSAAEFGLSEALFKNVPSLKAIYDKYIDPKSGMTDDEFRKLIRNDNWYLKNSKEIKNRFVQLYNYKDLVASGQAQGTTDYEKQIADLERQLLTKARQMGSAVASDPAALRKAAENWYITNVDINDPLVGDFLAAQIKPTFSTLGGVGQEGYSGEALKNYQELQGIAKRNGFKITDILPGVRNEQQALQAIATGAIDLNRINQDARRLAAQGQTQYVRDLLGQGYDLEQIYAPYKQTMANVLEIDDPNSIDLNDATLRSAITDKGDMNIYDFKKALKADNRWQYTEGARNEVSDAAFKVLRDFGFQG